MSRERLLTLSVIVLLILNISVVAILFTSNRPGPPRAELFELIVDDLDFSQEQQKTYFRMRDQHHQGMEKLNREFANTLEQYLTLISQEDSLKKLTLENKMADIEKAKADITLNHFRDVKNICTPDQQIKFEDLIPEISRYMSRPRQPRPPR